MPRSLPGTPVRTTSISSSIRASAFIIQPVLMGISSLGVATSNFVQRIFLLRSFIYCIGRSSTPSRPPNTDPSSSLGLGVSHGAASEMFLLLPCSAPRCRKLADQSCLSSDSWLDLAKEYRKEMENRKQGDVSVSSPSPLP